MTGHWAVDGEMGAETWNQLFLIGCSESAVGGRRGIPSTLETRLCEEWQKCGVLEACD